jgi:hypothetical protein
MSSLDDEIEECFKLGVPEPGGGFGGPLGQKEKELKEILRRDLSEFPLAEKGSQIAKEIVVAFSGLFTDADLLMVFEYLDCFL